MIDFFELYPITERVSFLQVKLDVLLKEFLNWQGPLVAQNSNFLTTKTISGNLSAVLLSLCPLTTVESRRYLMIQTNNNWVAFFDNGHVGTDRTCPSVMAEVLNSKYVYLSSNSDSQECLLDYYEIINGQSQLARSIGVIKEGGWKFIQYGKPLNFEKTDRYNNRLIKSRVDFDLLKSYLLELGIDAFNEDYYNLKNGAVLINKVGPIFPQTKELTLKEAKDFFK